MANPKGAKAREPYQNLDEGRSLPGINYASCQRLARGLESGLKPSLGQGGLGSCDPCREPCIIAAPFKGL